MPSVFFIAPADLGEAVLSTGALAHSLTGDDEVTIVCDPEAVSLFRAVPGLAETHVIDPKAAIASWLQLVFGGVQGHDNSWDIGIDARGGLPGQLLGVRLRRAVSERHVRHQTEDWAEALGVDRPLAPKIWVDTAAREAAAAVAPGTGPLLALAPGGVEAEKRWPAERFAAVARRLSDGPLSGAQIVVLGAAERDASITRGIVSSLDADGVSARDLGAGPDLLTAAALLERATLCIGNDNALTHIAAAMGAPTLTLFGPTDERVRAPYGPRVRTLRGRSLEDIAASVALDGAGAMGEISIDAVEAAALDLLHAGGLR
jgi:lipopolysaccharide export system permease protein